VSTASKRLPQTTFAAVSLIEIRVQLSQAQQCSQRSFRIGGCALLGIDILAKTDVKSFLTLIVFLLEVFLILRCRECSTLALVPANGQQLRSNGVLRHEAVVVERLEQRDVWKLSTAVNRFAM
jgi:hypothetical protein